MSNASIVENVRTKLGLSVKSFAKKMGVYPSTVVRWSHGSHNPRTVYVMRAKVLARMTAERSAKSPQNLRKKAFKVTAEGYAGDVDVSGYVLQLCNSKNVLGGKDSPVMFVDAGSAIYVAGKLRMSGAKAVKARKVTKKIVKHVNELVLS